MTSLLVLGRVRAFLPLSDVFDGRHQHFLSFHHKIRTVMPLTHPVCVCLSLIPTLSSSVRTLTTLIRVHMCVSVFGLIEYRIEICAQCEF